jgi:SNF2 family DNA or RNA helicase
VSCELLTVDKPRLISQICYDVISNPRITTCAHACELTHAAGSAAETIVCLDCITEVLRRSSLCPLDRRQLPPGSLIELPPDDVAGNDEDDLDSEPKQKQPIKSAKIEELVKLLQLFPATDKSLVFSQFTGFLSHVATALDAAGISYCRFEGSMPAKTVSWGFMTKSLIDCSAAKESPNSSVPFQKPVKDQGKTLRLCLSPSNPGL